MSSQILMVIELSFFVMLVIAYFYVATHPDTSKGMKVKEIILMYSITFFYAFSKRISAVIFLMAAVAVIIFKILNAKDEQHGRESKKSIS